MLLLVVLSLGCGGKSTEPNPDALPETAVATDDNVAVRTDPLSMASEVESLSAGARVKLLQRGPEKVRVGKYNEYWYLVQLESGLKGWVYGAKLSIGASAQVAASGEEMIEEFRKQLVGKWWEVRSDGSTGFRKFAFWKDNKYKYGYGAEYFSEGQYDIIVGRKLVHLEKGSGVGEELVFKAIGRDLRLQAEYKGSVYTFRRGESDPDGPEGPAEPKATTPAAGGKKEAAPAQ